MAASVKGTPNTSTSNTVTIPSHAVGDDIFIFAFRDGSTTVPSKPSASGTVPAWVDIESGAGANSCSARLAHFVATATNHTSGTWTNATGMIAVVVQNQASSSIGGHAEGGGTSSTLATAPSITQQQTTGKALILEFYGHRTVTAWSTAPSGYTRQASNTTEVCLNSKNSSTSDGSISQNCTTSASGGYRGITLEIISTETSPTVALDSPADASSGSDTTPDLQFTGTDSESDDVTYQIEVDTANTFNSQSPTLLTSYSESNNDDFGRLGVDFTSTGECFNSGNGGVINSCKFEINKVGSPTGNVIAAIYAVTGTFGTNATPTGSELAHSDNINVSTLPTGRTVTTFTFSGANKIELTPNTNYFVILYWTGGDASNYISIWADTTSPTYAGNFWDVVGGGSSGLDLGFYFYIDTPLLNKFSSSDAGFSGPGVSDSYTVSPDGNWKLDQATFGLGQSFNAGSTGSLRSAKFILSKSGSPTGNAVAKLYAHSGTYGTSSLPTGAALSTSDNFDVSTLTTDKTVVKFVFSTPYTLNSGTKYVITVEYNNGTSSNYVFVWDEGTVASHSGNEVFNQGSWSYDAAYDVVFKVYANTSDIFCSGDSVTYTVQSALSDGTYYWKVRAKDPSGSNTWGSWSTIRSFTLTSATQTSQTITGISRITKSTLQTILGKARITVSTVRTILGKSRIGLVTSRTVHGIARITKVVSRTITGKSRITKSTSQTITGKASVQTTVTTDKTILGKARVTVSTLKTILGRSRIGLVTSRTITGVSRVTKIVSRTITGLSRITKQTTRTILGKSRITASTSRTILGRARIGLVTLKTITGKSRVTKVVTRTITGISDIFKSTSRTIVGKSRIGLVTTRTITGISRVTSQVLRTTVGRARIQISTSKTILGISTIGSASTRTIVGKSRIALVTTKTILGKARVSIQSSRTIQGISRIGLITVKNILGKSRISKSVSRNITGISSLAKLTSRVILGKSRIAKIVTRTILGKSNISKTTDRTITGMASIVKLAPIPKGRVRVESNKPTIYRVVPKYSHSLDLYDESGPYDSSGSFDGEVIQISSTILSSKLKSNKPLNYFIAPTKSKRLGIFDEDEPYDEPYPYDGEFVPGAASGWRASVKNVKVRVR